jgi:hypothetical protein
MRRMLSLLAILAFPAVSFAQTPGVYTPGSPQVPDLSGKWCGYWISDKNGHNGPLNATFKPHGCDSYRVTFSGRFAKVIPFRYTTTMNVLGTGDGVVTLTAEKRLGLGSFRTTATATATNFDANFTSGRDDGRFVMTKK